MHLINLLIFNYPNNIVMLSKQAYIYRILDYCTWDCTHWFTFFCLIYLYNFGINLRKECFDVFLLVCLLITYTNSIKTLPFSLINCIFYVMRCQDCNFHNKVTEPSPAIIFSETLVIIIYSSYHHHHAVSYPGNNYRANLYGFAAPIHHYYQ